MPGRRSVVASDEASPTIPTANALPAPDGVRRDVFTGRPEPEATRPMAGFPRHWDFDEVYDSVDRGCGDFIIDLRAVMRELDPGDVLMIASRDAGAPMEIPAWCRLTGNPLLDMAPPFYLVRKRDDAPAPPSTNTPEETT